jgi:hypothetical protein
MIPARRDGMLTEIPLIIQILKSVYMFPPLILPRWDLGNSQQMPGSRQSKMKNSHINTSSRLAGTKNSHINTSSLLGRMNFSLLTMRKNMVMRKNICNKNMMSST